jgi:hypothetical protein
MRKTLSGGFLARPFGKLGLRSGAKVVILARHRDGWQLPGLPPTVIAFQEKKKGKNENYHNPQQKYPGKLPLPSRQLATARGHVPAI